MFYTAVKKDDNYVPRLTTLHPDSLCVCLCVCVYF